MQIHSWSLYSEAALLLLQEASQQPVWIGSENRAPAYYHDFILF